MKRRLVGALLALLLAGGGTLVLLAYVRGAERRALAGERTVAVLVVRDGVASGANAAEIVAATQTKRLAAKVVPAGAVTQLKAVEGKVAAVALVPGEVLLAGRLVDPEELTSAGVVRVPEGLHTLTLKLEPERALGGRVRPGDTVGVFASFSPDVTAYATGLLLHRVLVTDVAGAPATPSPDAKAGEAAAAPEGEVFVTLALDAAKAAKLVFALEQGKVWLSDEPKEADQAPVAPVKPEGLLP